MDSDQKMWTRCCIFRSKWQNSWPTNFRSRSTVFQLVWMTNIAAELGDKTSRLDVPFPNKWPFYPRRSQIRHMDSNDHRSRSSILCDMESIHPACRQFRAAAQVSLPGLEGQEGLNIDNQRRHISTRLSIQTYCRATLSRRNDQPALLFPSRSHLNNLK